MSYRDVAAGLAGAVVIVGMSAPGDDFTGGAVRQDAAGLSSGWPSGSACAPSGACSSIGARTTTRTTVASSRW
jgi:hypothetical protein